MPRIPRRGTLNRRFADNVVKQTVSRRQTRQHSRRLDEFESDSSTRNVPHYEEDPYWASKDDDNRGSQRNYQSYGESHADRIFHQDPRNSWYPRKSNPSVRGRGAGKRVKQSEPPLLMCGIPRLERSFVKERNEDTAKKHEGDQAFAPPNMSQYNASNASASGSAALRDLRDVLNAGDKHNTAPNMPHNSQVSQPPECKHRSVDLRNVINSGPEMSHNKGPGNKTGDFRPHVKDLRQVIQAVDDAKSVFDTSNRLDKPVESGPKGDSHMKDLRHVINASRGSVDKQNPINKSGPSENKNLPLKKLCSSENKNPPVQNQTSVEEKHFKQQEKFAPENQNTVKEVEKDEKYIEETQNAATEKPNSSIEDKIVDKGTGNVISVDENTDNAEKKNSSTKQESTEAACDKNQSKDTPLCAPMLTADQLPDTEVLDKETEKYYEELHGVVHTDKAEPVKKKDDAAASKATLSATQVAKITKKFDPADVEKEKEKKKQDDIQTAWSILHQYWEFVRVNPYDFNGWTYLLTHVENMDNLEAARSAFEGFLPLYPYCFAYWKKLSDMEAKHKEIERSMGILLLGTQCIPFCNDLWVPLLEKYITYAKKEKLPPENVRLVYEFGLQNIGISWHSSAFWEGCISYELYNGDMIGVMSLYKRLLKTPTRLYNKHWDHFLALIRDHHPINLLSIEDYENLRKETCESLKMKYTPSRHGPSKALKKTPQPEDKLTSVMKENLVASYIKTHESNEEQCDKRWKFEERIKRPYFHSKPLDKKQLRNWKDYLDFETKEGDPLRIIPLFERCLVACALYEEYWCQYCTYMERHVQNIIDGKYKDFSLDEMKKDSAGSEGKAAESSEQKETESSVSESAKKNEKESVKESVGGDVVAPHSNVVDGQVINEANVVDVKNVESNDVSKNMRGSASKTASDTVVPMECSDVVDGAAQSKGIDSVDDGAAQTVQSDSVATNGVAQNIESDSVAAVGAAQSIQSNNIVKEQNQMTDSKDSVVNEQDQTTISNDSVSYEQDQTTNSKEALQTAVKDTVVDESTVSEVKPEPLTIDKIRSELCANLSLDERVLKCPPLTPQWIMTGVSWEDVRQIYRRGAWIHCPSKPSLLMQWAEFEEIQGNLETARELLNTVIAKYPTILKARMQLIEMERRAGCYDKVEAMYINASKALTQPRQRSWLAIKFARFLFKMMMEPDRALAILRKALKKDRGYVHLYHHVFDICYQRQPLDCQGVLASVLLALASKELPVEDKYWFAYKRVQFLREHGDIASLKSAMQEHEDLGIQAGISTLKETKSSSKKVKETSKKENEETKKEDEKTKEGNEEKKEEVATSTDVSIATEATATTTTTATSALPTSMPPPNTQFPVPFFSADGGITYSPIEGYGYGHAQPNQNLPTGQDVVKDATPDSGKPVKEYHSVPPSWELEIQLGSYGYANSKDHTWHQQSGHHDYDNLVTKGYPSHMKDHKIEDTTLPIPIKIDHLRNKPTPKSCHSIPDISQPPPDVGGPQQNNSNNGNGNPNFAPIPPFDRRFQPNMGNQPPNQMPFNNNQGGMPQNFAGPSQFQGMNPAGMGPPNMGPHGMGSNMGPPGMGNNMGPNMGNLNMCPPGMGPPNMGPPGMGPFDMGNNMGHPGMGNMGPPGMGPNMGPSGITSNMGPPGMGPSDTGPPGYGPPGGYRDNYPPRDDSHRHFQDGAQYHGKRPYPNDFRPDGEPPNKMSNASLQPYRPEYDDNYNSMPGPSAPPSHRANYAEREEQNRNQFANDPSNYSTEPSRLNEPRRYSLRDETFDFSITREIPIDSENLSVNVPDWLMQEGGELRLSETTNGPSLIRYWPNFMTQQGYTLLFRVLRKRMKWHQRRALVDGHWHNMPHLLSWIGPCDYNYSGVTLPKNSEWLPEIVDLLHRLIRYTDNQYNCCYMALHRNGYDHTTWASENHLALRKNPSVASVSLGTTRVLEMRRKSGNGYLRFPLQPGSLLLMEGSTQEDWLHQFPKQPMNAGERIHLVFRKFYMIEGLTV